MGTAGAETQEVEAMGKNKNKKTALLPPAPQAHAELQAGSGHTQPVHTGPWYELEARLPFL